MITVRQFLFSAVIITLTGSPFKIGAADSNSPDASDSSSPPKAEMTVRFELFVKDTHLSAEFYTRVLGFTCDTDSGPYIRARNGSVKIGICEESSLSEGHYFSPEALKGRKGVGAEIVLEVDDLDAFYQRVVKTGVQETIVRRPWGLRDFRLVDPDGYYLRITERRSPAAP